MDGKLVIWSFTTQDGNFNFNQMCRAHSCCHSEALYNSEKTGQWCGSHIVIFLKQHLEPFEWYVSSTVFLQHFCTCMQPSGEGSFHILATLSFIL